MQMPVLLRFDSLNFPPADLALDDPDGLLAIGGDLRPERLLAAYSQGIFPWYSDGQPILWWSPSERATLEPDNLKISRSLRKTLRAGKFTFSADKAFSHVIAGCAAPRAKADGTWITPEMMRAYCRLHALGYAHSIETWCDGKLVGGLYGLAIGPCYFGESMFSSVSDASKAAFVVLINHLVQQDCRLIDCQMMNPYLESLGATPLPRRDYLQRLRCLLQDFPQKLATTPAPTRWHLTEDTLERATGIGKAGSGK